MRLMHCKKCGTLVGTTDTIVERMMDEIKEERKKAIKDTKNKAFYLQNAKQMQKFLNQIMHTYSQIEERKVAEHEELAIIKSYILNNNLISEHELHELENIARNKAERMNAEDERNIAMFTTSFDSISNRTKKDTTATNALKNISKEVSE